MKDVEFLPISFPRIIDFLPLMSMQQQVDGGKTVADYTGTASIKLGDTMKNGLKSKEHDLFFTQSIPNRQQTDVTYDGGSLDNTLPLKTIWNETLDYLGAETPEIVTRRQFTVTKTPYQVEKEESFSHLDKIGYREIGVGHYTKSIKRKFGLHAIRNPYNLIKNDLIERNQWNPSISKRLRSVLKQETILGFSGDGYSRGWTELFKIPPEKNYAFPPEITNLLRGLTTRKWWTDIGIPRHVLGNANGFDIEAAVYLLSDRHNLIAV